MFLLVDAGNEPKKDWALKLDGPSGAEFISALAGVGVDAAARLSYSAFELTMKNYRDALVRWRCSLPKAEVTKIIGQGSWSCSDLQFFIGRVDFDQLETERAKRLDAIPTRFKLPVETVDELIAAGGDALLRSPTYRNFRGKL